MSLLHTLICLYHKNCFFRNIFFKYLLQNITDKKQLDMLGYDEKRICNTLRWIRSLFLEMIWNKHVFKSWLLEETQINSVLGFKIPSIQYFKSYWGYLVFVLKIKEKLRGYKMKYWHIHNYNPKNFHYAIFMRKCQG